MLMMQKTLSLILIVILKVHVFSLGGARFTVQNDWVTFSASVDSLIEHFGFTVETSVGEVRV